MKGSRQITWKAAMIHSANPDHSVLAVPQSHCWGSRQTTSCSDQPIPPTPPPHQHSNEIDLPFNLGLGARFYSDLWENLVQKHDAPI